MKRLLLTGPVASLAEWAAAARGAGWEPIELPLLEVTDLDLDPRAALADQEAPDWLVITSSGALPFVERALAAFPVLRRARLGVVGAQTAARLAALGLRPALEPADDADKLASALAGLLQPGQTVLWPHGQRSDDLADVLEARGAHVVAPVVYESRERAAGPLPACEAVFFASPSAVRRWSQLHTGQRPAVAIAIGRTTLEALHAGPGCAFARALALPEATPLALALALAHI